MINEKYNSGASNLISFREKVDNVFLLDRRSGLSGVATPSPTTGYIVIR